MNEPSLSLTFLGAAGTVTGSKTLVEVGDKKILVDCGLFQGLKAFRQLNRQPLIIEPRLIDAVIITHAHLDHVGYLPLLVRNGFRGKIYCTPPTFDLAKIILTDSAKLQEEEARLANRGGYTKHSPAEPLYTRKDAQMAQKYFHTVPDKEWVALDEKIKFRFIRNGHLLGSCLAELDAAGTMIVFSGDLGRPESLLLESPNIPSRADYLVMESTYGDRYHSTEPADIQLATIINETLRKGGNLLIPTFAVERAQEIMYLINLLKERNMIPPHVPVFLDSPMGIDATQIMMKHPSWHKLSKTVCKNICKDITMVRELKQTRQVMKQKGQKIIIAGSGMLSGGRALEYLKNWIEKESTTVLFVGFQAEGTRGRAMLRGADKIKIHGQYYNVHARLKEISSFSGHADRGEILGWLGKFKTQPRKIFLNHGELKSSESLRQMIDERFHTDCVVPLLNQRFTL